MKWNCSFVCLFAAVIPQLQFYDLYILINRLIYPWNLVPDDIIIETYIESITASPSWKVREFDVVWKVVILIQLLSCVRWYRGAGRLRQAGIPASRVPFGGLCSRAGGHVGRESWAAAGACVAASLRACLLQVQRKLHDAVWRRHDFSLRRMLIVADVLVAGVALWSMIANG